MSSQRGNLSRTRKPKYQNAVAFKNDKHDKSPQTKAMNSMSQEGLCHRCISIIEWKIKYKKYKPLTQPATCILCNNKSVKKAYHRMCQPCAQKTKVCAKCNEGKKIVTQPGPSEEEERAQELAAKFELMHLPERKRRTVLRFIEKGGSLETAGITHEDEEDDFLDEYFKDSENDNDDDKNSDNNHKS